MNPVWLPSDSQTGFLFLLNSRCPLREEFEQLGGYQDLIHGMLGQAGLDAGGVGAHRGLFFGLFPDPQQVHDPIFEAPSGGGLVEDFNPSFLVGAWIQFEGVGRASGSNAAGAGPGE